MGKRNRFIGSRNRRKHQPKTTRYKQVALHIEQLEQRMLMNADNGPAPLAAIDVVTIDNSIQVLPVLTAPIRPTVMPVVNPIADDDIGDMGLWRSLSPKPLPEVPEEGFESVEDLRGWVIDAIDAQYGHLFGTSYVNRYLLNSSCYVCDVGGLGLSVAESFSTFDNYANNASVTNSFSGTNVQVEGVDEADLLETDGKYLYLVSGKELIIVDASDGEDLSIVSRVKLEDRQMGIYLSEDRLTLISTRSNRGWANRGYASWGHSSTLNPTTTVTVLDLTDRAAPGQVQKTAFQGSLVSSRMVDGQLRLVLNQSGFRRFALPQPKLNYTFNEETGLSGGTYETRNEYLDRVLDDAVDSFLPTYRTYSIDGELLDQEWLMQPNKLQRYPSPRIIIATFDVLGNDAGPADVETLQADGATEVYSTQDSLYVFEQSSRYFGKTSIWKFDFDSEDHSITLNAKGQVAGTLLNQFSVDEYDGFLRVVTKGRSWRSGASLFVFEQVGNRLKVVGSVDGLAPGERLHSVRFLGKQAFVVTFKKVDPLFAIDLSDPTNPTVAGELKIPGYSDYLQPIGENYLLGIGRDAPVQGGLFQEMQISIFDVSDLNDPRLAHRFSLEGGRSTASIATGGRWTQGDGDPHALSYFPSEQILAMPIHRESRRGWSNTPIFDLGEGGLQVFSIDTESGIESIAIIEHDTPILRSLRIGETLLAFSAGEISSHDITGSINQLDSLQLLIGSDVGLVELTTFNTPLSAADLQTVANYMTTKLGTRAFPATLEGLGTPQIVAAETLLPEFSADPLNLNILFSSPDATDSVFSTVDSNGGEEDFRFALDDILFDELVHDQLGS